MKYLKIAAAELITSIRWLLATLAYALEATVEGLDWLSARLDGLRDMVRR